LPGVAELTKAAESMPASKIFLTLNARADGIAILLVLDAGMTGADGNDTSINLREEHIPLHSNVKAEPFRCRGVGVAPGLVARG
jgi:hypothetical protein